LKWIEYICHFLFLFDFLHSLFLWNHFLRSRLCQSILWFL
jgi:hypothetical protein